jgi:hypothetical protein
METYYYIPRTKTQIKILNNLLEKINNDNAILIGKYDTIRTNDDIHFKCNCGICDKKNYNQLIDVSGAFCKTCTKKHTLEKRIKTVKDIYNVDNISQLEDIKQKKAISAKESGNIITFMEWKYRISDTKLDTVWEYLFDEIKGYDTPHPMRHKVCGNIIYTKTPRGHLNQDNINTFGQGCTYCYHDSNRMKKNDFIKLSIERFGNRFSGYENIPDIISNNHTLISLICNLHGKFSTYYPTHLCGNGGCIACSNNIKTKKEILDLYSNKFKTNGIVLELNDYNDNDLIILSNKYEAKCLKNNSHPSWEPTLSNVIKANTGCPMCCTGRQYSKGELEWLEFHMISRPNLQTIMSIGGQGKIQTYKLDGKESIMKEAYEYNGCWFHGCQLCFPNRNEINTKTKKTYKVLYDETIKKKNTIIDNGFKYIGIWEHQWNMAKKAIKKIQLQWKKIKNKKIKLKN